MQFFFFELLIFKSKISFSNITKNNMNSGPKISKIGKLIRDLYINLDLIPVQ